MCNNFLIYRILFLPAAIFAICFACVLILCNSLYHVCMYHMCYLQDTTYICMCSSKMIPYNVYIDTDLLRLELLTFSVFVTWFKIKEVRCNICNLDDQLCKTYYTQTKNIIIICTLTTQYTSNTVVNIRQIV